MNTDSIAAALNTIAVAFGELAEAMTEQPDAGTSGVVGREAMSPVATPAPTFSDGIPVEEPPLFPDQWPEEAQPIGMDAFKDPPSYTPPVQSERDRALSECPVHFKAWTIKEGGMSKNGKPYSAFWKCSGKNPDNSYCDKKPTKEWIKTHDPEKALAAA